MDKILTCRCLAFQKRHSLGTNSAELKRGQEAAITEEAACLLQRELVEELCATQLPSLVALTDVMLGEKKKPTNNPKVEKPCLRASMCPRAQRNISK